MERVAISIFFIAICSLFSWSQENNVLPPLERSLSIKLVSNSAKEALKIMEDQGKFSFAFKTDIVDSSHRLSRTYQNQTTREILDDIFQGEITYSNKGNYILLKKSPKLKVQEVIIEGYVFDLTTGEKITYATIYDTVSFTSTISNEYGHYSLKLSNPEEAYLNVKKIGYRDTSLRIAKSGTEIISIRLQPLNTDSLVSYDKDSSYSLSKIKNIKFLKISDERKANILNFKDQLKTKLQVSLIPSIGTNGLLSSSTAVDYSFNIFGGITGGVRKLEIGGFFNIDVDSVHYFQIAGFLNAVGGYQHGLQFAGFTNLNYDSFKGGQFSGFLNFVRKDFHGIQASGFGNVTLGKFNGIQAAGFFNVNTNSSRLIQLAGFYNYAGNNSTGIQIAGFMNFAGKNFKGSQLAGFLNYTRKDFKGIQVAGFLNIASNVKGSQLSFININDTISGIPIGFFSYSRKGLHQIELSTNEILPLQLAFKTGINSFYNSFIGGIRTNRNSAPIWAFGYGIGTSVRFSDKSRMYFDLQAMSLQQNKFSDGNNLGKLTISYQYQIKKKFAISGGPSFNILSVKNASLTPGIKLVGITPYSLYSNTFAKDTNVQMWIGGHIALRLF